MTSLCIGPSFLPEVRAVRRWPSAGSACRWPVPPSRVAPASHRSAPQPPTAPSPLRSPRPARTTIAAEVKGETHSSTVTLRLTSDGWKEEKTVSRLPDCEKIRPVTSVFAGLQSQTVTGATFAGSWVTNFPSAMSAWDCARRLGDMMMSSVIRAARSKRTTAASDTALLHEPKAGGCWGTHRARRGR